MKINPYSAPGSSFKHTEEGARPRRPLSLLLLQISMVGVIIVASLYLMLLGTSSTRDAAAEHMTVVLVLVWSIAIIGAGALRSPALRWLGGSAIALLIAATASGIMAELDRSSPWTLPTGALFLAGEIYWLHALAFSAKAKRYLGVK